MKVGISNPPLSLPDYLIISFGTPASLSRLVHVFLGIYIWECVMFLDVDWSFVASLVNTVFIRLNLNPVMAVIAIVPSTVIISIASGRVIRSGGESSRAFIRPKAAEQQSAATQYPAHKQTRLSLRQWPSNSGSPRREAFDPLKVHRLRLPSTLHANTVQATNSTRSSSITLPSLNPPPSIYIPNRASQNPSTHLDSDSETSTKGDCYDLDAQLIAVERRDTAHATGMF
ncbi:hypothetical protein EYR40_000324 [Pleurotus pulmonarius]|nr:hypothetical protein EYR36_001315 [Pleurotus pulmonarius]KAF4607983.1 hypothetical protein EYR40_000324 [Pleurotus pulmonarius]